MKTFGLWGFPKVRGFRPWCLRYWPSRLIGLGFLAGYLWGIGGLWRAGTWAVLLVGFVLNGFFGATVWGRP
jgi:uncharacterized membrane protein YccC